MGWTWYHVPGKIDRRREIDNELFNFEESTENRTIKSKVLKSCMRGSTYYGAVERIDNGKREVFAAVVLTGTNTRDYFNFGYKAMSEYEGPYKYDCPASILDLLTETDSEYAKNWRSRCRENLNKPKLSDVPTGSRICFTFCGREYTAQKMAPNHQFKTAWFLLDDGHYMPKKNIKDFRIIPEPRTA